MQPSQEAIEAAAEAVFRVEHPEVHTAVAPDWTDLHPIYKGVWLTYAVAALNAAYALEGQDPT